MSGFLRRLATQAMGVAKPVRTATSLPFAGPPDLAKEFIPVAGDIGPVASASGAPFEELVDLAAPVAVVAEASAGQRRGGGTRHADPLVRSTTSPPAGSSQDRAIRAEVKAREQAINNASSSGPSLRMTDERDAAPLPGPLPEREPYPADAKAQEPATGRKPTADSLSIGVGPSELLLRLQAHPKSARGLLERERPGSERRTGGSRSAAVEETTEVHVNIGRIEVTAMHEAPPPKRAVNRPARPAPMSLDDYLAKRQGGRS